MADTYTQALKVRKIEQGGYAPAYANRFNADVVDIFDASISGSVTVDIGSNTTYALAAMQNGTLSETHYWRLNFVGTPAGAVTVTMPASVTPSKHYLVDNQTGQTITIKYAATAGVEIQDGDAVHIYCDGTTVTRDSRAPKYDPTPAEIAAGVTPANKAYEEGYMLRYLSGAFVSDSTDCTSALQDLLAVLRQTKGTGWLPYGTIRYTSELALDASGIALRGVSKWGTKLKKVGNFVGIRTTSETSLSDFTLDSAGGTDASAGIIVRAQGRVDFRSVVIQNQGSHGLWAQESSLSYYSDIVSLLNAGDGVRLDATVAPLTASSFVNANTFINIDTRGNTGNGLNLVEAYSNYIFGVTSQNNTGDGVRLDDARANYISCYAEFQTGDDIALENNANCRANTIIVLEGSVVDLAPADSNNIIYHNRAGTFDAHTRHQTTMKLIIPSDAYDGSQYQGVLDLTHTANRTYKFIATGFAGTQTLHFENSDAAGMDVVTDRYTAKTSGYFAHETGPTWTSGSGSPESVITAPIGSMYSRTDGGATTSLYVKESGAGNTGWVAK